MCVHGTQPVHTEPAMWLSLVLVPLGAGAAASPCDLGPSVFVRSTNGSLSNPASDVCACAMKPCIRKCCGYDEEFVITRPPKGTPRLSCGGTKRPSLFDNFTLPVYSRAKEEVHVPKDHFGIIIGDICPAGRFWLNPSITPYDRNFLMTNGNVMLIGTEDQQIYLDVTQYCLESVEGTREIYTFVSSPACSDPGNTKFLIYPVGMILSVPFLLATLLSYAVLAELHNAHGYSIICHIVSLVVANTSLSFCQLYNDLILKPTLCTVLGESLVNLDTSNSLFGVKHYCYKPGVIYLLEEQESCLIDRYN